jgi:hypothetical protein
MVHSGNHLTLASERARRQKLVPGAGEGRRRVSGGGGPVVGGAGGPGRPGACQGPARGGGLVKALGRCWAGAREGGPAGPGRRRTGAGDVAPGVAAGQHVLPELLVDVVEDVDVGVDVGEGLGREAQADVVVVHDLQHLRWVCGCVRARVKGVRVKSRQAALAGLGDGWRPHAGPGTAAARRSQPGQERPPQQQQPAGSQQAASKARAP